MLWAAFAVTLAPGVSVAAAGDPLLASKEQWGLANVG